MTHKRKEEGRRSVKISLVTSLLFTLMLGAEG